MNLEIRKSLDDLIHDTGDTQCIHPVFSMVIARIRPLGYDEPVESDKVHRMDTDPSSRICVRPSKYRGPYPPYPHGYFPCLHAISQAHAELTLIKETICPHRGTDLTGITPDDAGVITCPPHGLRWVTSTGEIVMPKHNPGPNDRQL